MSKFEVTVSDEATYVVDAEDRTTAILMAEEWFSERVHHTTIKEIPQVEVALDPLREFLVNWVETFNDCACCPCQNCPLVFGVSFYECADHILDLLKKGEVE
jgi:hypothetical protein